MAKNIKYVRLILSGSLIGVAVAGLVAPLFGFGVAPSADVVGAVAGGSVAALALKLAHVV